MGNRMTLEEQIKANKRVINKAVREMDRERMQLERDQKRLEADIRNLAKKGQMNAVRVAAKDLVRTRQHVEKFHQMTSTLKGLNMKMTTMKTSNEITNAMGKMAKAMKQMNKKMNVPKMQEMMMEFQKQEGQMEMFQEMQDDLMDDVMGDSGLDEDELVNKVLDEIGVDVAGGLKEAPTGGIAEKEAAGEKTPVADAGVSDLEARLQNLRREG